MVEWVWDPFFSCCCGEDVASLDSNGDKGEKSKSNKIDRHCIFCGKYDHGKSKCSENMEALDTTMKKHNVNIDSTSSSYSHRHALYAFGFSFNATSTSSSDEWLIDSGASYHMDNEKTIFSL